MSVEAHRAKAEAKLEEYQARLGVARAKLKGASADARLEIEKQIAGMEANLEAARSKASGLAAAADDAWSDLTDGLDAAFEGMSSAVKSFFSKSG
jgi:hypothetical protein